MGKLGKFQVIVTWEQRKLGEVVTVNGGKDYKHLQPGSIPVYGTGGYMLSVNESLSAKKDAIGIGRKGTIDNPYILRAPFWTVDTLFYAIPREKNNLGFTFALFERTNWKKFDESTGVPSLSKSTINAASVFVTRYSEQERIGCMLRSIENTIALHERKLALLKELKKAYLQQMFPENGAKTPLLRFAGFTDDWEQRKLFDVITDTVDFRGRTPRKLGLDWSPSGYISLSALNVKNGYIDFTADVHYGNDELYNRWMAGKELKKGQVLFTMEAPVGNVAQVPDDRGYILSQRVVSFIPDKKKIGDDFLMFLLSTPFVQKKIKSLATGGTAQGVSQKSLNLLNISFPSFLDEQNKIWHFIGQLSDTITLHKRTLDSFRELRQAYLQKLFV